jgi:hypothetical protein
MAGFNQRHVVGGGVIRNETKGMKGSTASEGLDAPKRAKTK